MAPRLLVEERGAMTGVEDRPARSPFQGAKRAKRGNEKGPAGFRPRGPRCGGSGLVLGDDVRGPEALVALGDLEGDLLAVAQGLEPLRGDGREVAEDVLPVIAGDEPEALLIREPLHSARCHRPTS